MMHERRITPSGAWVEKRKPPDPASMTDKELKAKVCGLNTATCRKCGMFSGCKYGKEYVRRFEKGA